MLGNAVLLERPLNVDSLASAARVALRARRRQLALRDLTATLENRVAERTAALAESDVVTLHCPPAQIYALGSFLRDHGADTVSVASLDYVLDRENPLFAKLEAFLR